MKIQSSSSRWLVGIGLAVLALIVLSVVVALLNRQGEATLLPEDTPEGTVQRYLWAIQENDDRTAYSYLSSELQEKCTYEHFRDSTRWLEGDDMRVTLEGTEPLNGKTEVRVKVTQFHVDLPFGTSESSHSQSYTLEKENGAWRFVAPPWPMGWCPELEKGLPLDVPRPVEVK